MSPFLFFLAELNCDSCSGRKVPVNSPIEDNEITLHCEKKNHNLLPMTRRIFFLTC